MILILILILPLILGSPSAAARAGRTSPQGPREGSRGVCERTRTYVEQTPACPRGPVAQSAKGAAPGAHSLWFLSLVRARERNPRAGRARKTEGMRSEKNQKQRHW